MANDYSRAPQASWEDAFAARVRAEVPRELAGRRLDQALAQMFPQYSRSRLQQWLREGHVRVDILYANLSARAKAWSNAIGSLVLGAPVCWVIMTIGMSDKSNVINSPLINYEVTQAGFGMYVKYLMAGFLAIYALTMLIQFMSYFLNSVGILFQEADAKAAPAEEAHF